MEPARNPNDEFAKFYDRWNSQNDYEMWLGGVLLPEMEKHGLRKGWALDVGCGTGQAFGPLLARGWRLVGCDASPRMLAEADKKFGSQVELRNLDARDLPAISPSPGQVAGASFQLILLLNDVVNYLLEDGDLDELFLGIKGNLSQDRGLVIFDTNTLAQFRDDYLSVVRERMDRWLWRGLTGEARVGAIFEGEFSGPGISAHVHRQRHWTIDAVREAVEAAGLRCLAILGQREQEGRILLTEHPCEERDAKVIYIATHGASPR
jgi:SAM-dependent methyltransferase